MNKVLLISFITFVLSLYSTNYILIETVDTWYKLPTVILFGSTCLLTFILSILMILNVVDAYLRKLK